VIHWPVYLYNALYQAIDRLQYKVYGIKSKWSNDTSDALSKLIYKHGLLNV